MAYVLMTSVRNRATTMRMGSSFQNDLSFFLLRAVFAGGADLASASFIRAPPASPVAFSAGCPPGASPGRPCVCVAGGSPEAFPSSVIDPSLAPTSDYGSDIRAHSGSPEARQTPRLEANRGTADFSARGVLATLADAGGLAAQLTQV